MTINQAPRGVPAPFVVALLNQYLCTHQVLLDVGCGPSLYRNVTPARFIGLDYTDAPYYPDWPRDVDVVAEGDKLPLRADCVDLVMSKSAFFQFPEPDAALIDFFRVLRPGGRVILFDYNRRTQRRLERGENRTRPCWTQWQLRDRVQAAGFGQVEMLLPMKRQLPGLLRFPFLIVQELIGSWAIVTGVKSA